MTDVKVSTHNVLTAKQGGEARGFTDDTQVMVWQPEAGRREGDRAFQVMSQVVYLLQSGFTFQITFSYKLVSGFTH